MMTENLANVAQTSVCDPSIGDHRLKSVPPQQLNQPTMSHPAFFNQVAIEVRPTPDLIEQCPSDVMTIRSEAAISRSGLKAVSTVRANRSVRRKREHVAPNGHCLKPGDPKPMH
jgi:hypothetical protein